MIKIKNVEITKELKYKDVIILTYNIQYPEIVNPKLEHGINRFNEYNRIKALRLEEYIKNELYEDAKKIYDYNVANGYPLMVFEVILNYYITYQEDNFISLYYDQYEFTGGAHGNTIRSSQNWDLYIGKQLSLSCFYPNNPYYIIDILKEINYQIKRQMNLDKNKYFENYCELVLETFRLENYYIIPNGIVIYFQQYDIAPYSSGIPIFYIIHI